jgi:hypothetical protein
MRVAVIVLPSAASPRFDASFAMECQNIVGLGSKAARGQWQLNDMRIIPLVLSRGDFAFAPGHFSIGVVSFVFHIDVRLEACRQPWAIVGIRHVASWTGHTSAAAAAGSRAVPRLGGRRHQRSLAAVGFFGRIFFSGGDMPRR